MTLLTLALKNVRHQAKSYAAFFLSSAFAVWLFFMYASLLLHPDFGAEQVGAMIRSVMTFMEFIIAIFSMLFILYAHSDFLRTRRKELGLLTTLGMLPRQIAGLIWRENVLIGLGAIGIGIGMGLIFSRLFFLGIGRALDLPQPLPFHFAPLAALLSVVVFGVLFGVISLLSLLSLRRLSIAEIMREAVKTKAPPRFSIWLSSVGLTALATTYYLGLTGSPQIATLQWIIGLGTVGTYLLFSQGGSLLLRALQRRRGLYWRGTNLITISQLVYKLKDNARILFMITILSTTVITLVTLFYTGLIQAENNAKHDVPISVMLVGEPGRLTSVRADAILREQGLVVATTARLASLTGTLWAARDANAQASLFALPGVAVVSERGINQWIERMGLGQPVSVPADHAVVVVGNNWFNERSWPVRLSFTDVPGKTGLAGVELELPVSGPLALSVVNVSDRSQALVVLEDARFADLETRFPQTTIMFTGWMLPRWQDSAPAIMQMGREAGLAITDRKSTPLFGALTNTVSIYREQKLNLAFMVVICSFISLLFFLASGNMLYFKLFTDLQADKKQFQVLYKLGLAEEHVRRIVSTQTAVLFFAPLAVAVAHSALLIHFFGAVMPLAPWALWKPLALVTAVYLVLHGTYFLITRRTYTKALMG